jgi:hypothetical protein
MNMLMLTNMQDAQGKIKTAELATDKKSKELGTLQQQLEAVVARTQEDAAIRDQLEKAILELSGRLQEVDRKRAEARGLPLPLASIFLCLSAPPEGEVP